MALKKIVEVWDGLNLIESNIKFLKQQTKEVHLPLSEKIKDILSDLLDTYKATPCAGVAANQIGYNNQIFIGLKHDNYDDDNKAIGNLNADNYEFYINPKIYYSSNKSLQETEEGCLSIPEIRLITQRFDEIKIRYFNAEGKKIKKPLNGFMSKLFQHELDHLNGMLMLDNKIENLYPVEGSEEKAELYRKFYSEYQKLIK